MASAGFELGDHLGAILRPQNRPESVIAAARAAENAGLRELWVWEDCFLEGGLSTAAATLGSTDRLIVGVVLLPAPLRNVALLAMELATIQRMFPGRLRVAVGHGVQDWMGQVGARARSPLALMREYLTALRALLAGEQVTVTGDHVVLDGVRLDWPPTTTLPVLMGAVGPKSLALAGECADGVLLDGDLTVQGVRDSLAICRGARDAAGVTTPFASAVYQRYYRGADATAQLARETRPTAIAAGLVADRADGADIAAHARELLGAGVGTVVFMPSATDPDPIGYLAEIAHAAQRA